ncbi:glycosyltransferase, partial [bacterium]|nr:glycosyltransferase [bacterium]
AHLRSEAFGLSQIEAMVCGLPVISTDLNTGVREVNQDGHTGLVVKPANPKALADAILSLIQDSALREKLAAQAHKRALERFSARRLGDDLREAYRKILLFQYR